MTEENHNKFKFSTKAERVKNGIKLPNKKAHTSTENGLTDKSRTITPPLNDRTLIIDGDILIYKIAAQTEVPTDWGNNLWTLHSDFKEARDKLADTIYYYETTLISKRIVIALGSKGNFRKRINPTYKSNRKATRKPTVYNPLREWVEENYKCISFPDLEGDDVMGLLATSDNIIKGEKTLLTSDKDLKTIPATHWFLGDDNYTIINEAEADYYHMFQTLTGDVTDGYKGCPTIGKVTAAKILDPIKDNAKQMWRAVMQTYESKGLSEKVAIMEARMARILRSSDFNFETKKPILWSPPV